MLPQLEIVAKGRIIAGQQTRNALSYLAPGLRAERQKCIQIGHTEDRSFVGCLDQPGRLEQGKVENLVPDGNAGAPRGPRGVEDPVREVLDREVSVGGVG